MKPHIDHIWKLWPNHSLQNCVSSACDHLKHVLSAKINHIHNRETLYTFKLTNVELEKVVVPSCSNISFSQNSGNAPYFCLFLSSILNGPRIIYAGSCFSDILNLNKCVKQHFQMVCRLIVREADYCVFGKAVEKRSCQIEIVKKDSRQSILVVFKFGFQHWNQRRKFALSKKFDSWFTHCALGQRNSVSADFALWPFWLRKFSVWESKIAANPPSFTTTLS